MASASLKAFAATPPTAVPPFSGWRNTLTACSTPPCIVGFRDLPWTRDSLIDAIHKTISANKFSACYIRPVIYLDGAMNLVVDSGKPRLIIAVWEWTAFLGAEAKERGIRANIASFTRLHPNIMMTKAKVSGNYVELDSGQDRIPARRLR